MTTDASAGISCPRCHGALVPVLIQETTPEPSGPLLAEIPVALRCPICQEPTV